MLIWIRHSNRPVILATVNEPEEPKNKIYGTVGLTDNYNAWEAEKNNAPTLTDHDAAALEIENTNAATLSDYRIAALEIENINATTLSDYYAAASENENINAATLSDYYAAASEDDEDILLNTESYITDFSNLDLAEKENATQPEPEAIPSSARENETRTQPDEVPPPALSTAFNMTPEQLDELNRDFAGAAMGTQYPGNCRNAGHHAPHREISHQQSVPENRRDDAENPETHFAQTKTPLRFRS